MTTCRVVHPGPSADVCGAPATHLITFYGDEQPTPACEKCVLRLTELARTLFKMTLTVEPATATVSETK